VKKLTLDLDTLAVESFTAGEGGVLGRDTTTDCSQACTLPDCQDSAMYTGCSPCATAKTDCHQNTCAETCQQTCGSTCPEGSCRFYTDVCVCPTAAPNC
jgi:hypothetical protein